MKKKPRNFLVLISLLGLIVLTIFVLSNIRSKKGVPTERNDENFRKAKTNASENVSFTMRKENQKLRRSGIIIDGIVENDAVNHDISPLIVVVGAENHSVTLNGALFQSGTSIKKEGNYELVVTAISENNERLTKAIRFSLDKTPPILKVSGIENGKVYSESVRAEFTIEDNAIDTKLVCTLNGNEYTAGEFIDESGKYTLVAYAIDAAGNKSEESKYRFQIIANQSENYQGIELSNQDSNNETGKRLSIIEQKKLTKLKSELARLENEFARESTSINNLSDPKAIISENFTPRRTEIWETGSSNNPDHLENLKRKISALKSEMMELELKFKSAQDEIHN